MPAFTSLEQLPARKREAVPAPELGVDQELVIAEIGALQALEFQRVVLEEQRRANGQDVDLGLRGMMALLRYAIINPETGRPCFDDDALSALPASALPALQRAFVAAVRLNGFDGSAEGNLEADPSAVLPTGSP